MTKIIPIDPPRARGTVMGKQVSGVLADVRSCAHYGLKPDIAPCPKSANNGLMQR
jgi:hypothetical protein